MNRAARRKLGSQSLLLRAGQVRFVRRARLRCRVVLPSCRTRVPNRGGLTTPSCSREARSSRTAQCSASQAETGSLRTVGSDTKGAWGPGMMSGTSPSIAALPSDGYEVDFQANTGSLRTVGSDTKDAWGWVMMSGPSVLSATPDNAMGDALAQAVFVPYPRHKRRPERCRVPR